MSSTGGDVPRLPVGRFGTYELLERIGRGGMAELFLARSRHLGDMQRLVALKLVLPQYADDAEFREMFTRESKISLNLQHPFIAQVFDAGIVEDRSFIAMEYVHGWDLRAVLKQQAIDGTPMPMGSALAIVSAVCAGVHYAHECVGPDGAHLGIVHRDITPSNILLRFDGVVKVVDFGIAKATRGPGLTESGTIKGKRGYMSPEQCVGDVLDRRSDVFSLGILLYELVTGYRMFGGRGDFAVMNRITQGDYTPMQQVDPSIDEALARIVDKAVNPDRDERYQDAAQLQAEVDAFAREQKLDTSVHTLRDHLRSTLGDRPQPSPSQWSDYSPTQVTPGRPRGAERRSSGRAWPAIALVSAAAVGLGAIAWSGADPEPAPNTVPSAPEPAPPSAAEPSPPTQRAPEEAPPEPAAEVVAEPSHVDEPEPPPHEPAAKRKPRKKRKRKQQPRSRDGLFPDPE